ncbi:MAG: hypothetical protein METHP_00998 [Methanoregula sp. SKADARSKE-2]|nr:MAG: hypothetical protein METHP_00998 [Methanoregula sp. SKADARSKE-2]
MRTISIFGRPPSSVWFRYRPPTTVRNLSQLINVENPSSRSPSRLILSYRFSSAKSTRFSILVIDRTKIKYYRLQGEFFRILGKEITGERLVNKNLNFTYGDGFKASYFSKNMSAWYLFFSPDFVGYDNPGLSDHILEGNTYQYKFDVSDIVNKGVPNEIMIKNIGDEVAAQYNDPKTVEYYKSANIFINPIVIEGKGAELVQITKVAAPTRIIVGKNRL